MFRPTKSDIVLQTTSVTAAGTATAVIDTLGADFLELDLISTTADNATNNPSVLKLGEGDVTTSFTDITALVGDGTGGFTVPNWHTTAGSAKVFRFNVDLRHRKRYLLLTVSPVTTQSFTAVARLGFLEKSPVSADDFNALGVVSA